MAAPVITNNSTGGAAGTAPGSFYWTATSIQYAGVTYAIPASSSSKRYVYWLYNNGAPQLQAADVLPPLSPADYLLFVNYNGTAIQVMKAGMIDGGLLVNGSILAEALSANSVTALAILAGAVDTDKLAANAVTAEKIAANSIEADKIAANAISADKLAATLLLASKLIVDRISLSREEGFKIQLDEGIIQFPSDGSPATIYADIVAFSLTLMDALNIRGANNYLAGILSAASGIVDPTAAPTVTGEWIQHPEAQFPASYGNHYIAQGNDSSSIYSLSEDIFVHPDQWKPYRVTPGNGAIGAAGPTLCNDTDGWGIPKGFIALYDQVQGMPTGYLVKRNRRLGTTSPAQYENQFLIFNASFVLQATVVVPPTTFTTGYGSYGLDYIIGSEPGKILIGARDASNRIHLRKMSNAGVMESTTIAGTTGTFATTDGPYLIDGMRGTSEYVIHQYSKMSAISKTTLIENTARAMTKPAARRDLYSRACVFGANFGGASRYIEKDTDGKFFVYSAQQESQSRGFAYAWEDSTSDGAYAAGGKSRISAIKQVTILPGQFVRVHTPLPPDGGGNDDPDNVVVYEKPTGWVTGNPLRKMAAFAAWTGFSVRPAVNDFWYYYQPSTSDEASKTVSDFNGRPGAVGRFKSAQQPGWDLVGDGSGIAGPWEWNNAGRSTMDRCKIALPAVTGMPANTWTNLNLSRVIEDNDSMASVVSSIGRITIKKTGRYRVIGKARFASNAVGMRALSIKRTSSAGTVLPDVDVEYVGASNGSVTTFQGVETLTLNAGDYLHMQVNHSSTTTPLNLDGSTTAENYTYVSVEMIG